MMRYDPIFTSSILTLRRSPKGKDDTPEDHASLLDWITFNWVQPLIDKGTKTTLNENDVWPTSRLIKTKPVFLKYTSLKQKSVFWRVMAANSLDLIIDFIFTVVSVLLNYSAPVFLK